MFRIYLSIVILSAMTMLSVDVASGALPVPNAGPCYEETVRANSGADPNTLSTVACRRALRSEVLSRQDKSAFLHNVGIIQQAQGDLVAAKASFESAVRLSTTVDMRNLALAQVAFKLGDYRVALEQYDLLVASDFTGDSEAIRLAVAANREKAMQALTQAQFAKTQR